MPKRPALWPIARVLAVLLALHPAAVLADGQFAKARLMVPKNDKFEIVRLDKGNFSLALATLEADTGIKVERTEER